jgi:hypothetical protein
MTGKVAIIMYNDGALPAVVEKLALRMNEKMNINAR